MEFYQVISEEINQGSIVGRDDLQRRKITLAKELKLDHIPSDTEILRSGYVLDQNRNLLRIKPTRTISGVAVVAAMTSPESCPHGRCIYCPGGVDNNSPQAYTGHEPAALRGRHNNYDPYMIVFNRLKQLETIGHDTSKVDLIIMGGTFTARPKEYQENFIKGCFDAMNGEIAPSLQDSILLNERSKRRCIGLTVETKPDWFFEKDIDEALSYGTTKVELGVQILKEEALKLNLRGHGIQETVRSTRLSRDAGLKIVYHLMPGMYGTTIDDDRKSFDLMISDPSFKPDMLKIYPTLVVKGTSLYRLWKQGKYVPPDTDTASELIAYFMEKMPPWIRIQRMQRDIPVKFIEAGVKRSDLRNIVDAKLRERGIKTMEIRSREIMKAGDHGNHMELVRRDYEASSGSEVFLSFENEEHIFGFLRLRKPSDMAHRSELINSSIIREIKVLGEVVPIGSHSDALWQHKGIGRRLLVEAERISTDEWGYPRILVISGVGVREYFRKNGYERVGPYMGKALA
ncbi:MAG: tRNA uridine(34) 5-carboxymethylaminomethyl modification radical SAM/GNAT enzyme Elp3 [Candidatus Thermoplasmatota archaeon]|nr:tRNA uridine(34) 5-carboxymethylaminomethyl modification radical SAM/GNAT enzyme Elp3 [Candidatus Thermoplasmatota archaeon]MDA8142866.1 tRNA uridine(34) 5-carboxymethylaminomethyl modification radical SAM/GNAT enzyme Elp3 [Thermoplasmatales archaeon]